MPKNAKRVAARQAQMRRNRKRSKPANQELEQSTLTISPATTPEPPHTGDTAVSAVQTSTAKLAPPDEKPVIQKSASSSIPPRAKAQLQGDLIRIGLSSTVVVIAFVVLFLVFPGNFLG